MRFSSIKLNSFRDLYLEELRDLYDAENQLVKALPKMAEAAKGRQLRAAFTTHLGQTQIHISRLKQIFLRLGEQPAGETSRAMKGLIEEGKLMIDAEGDNSARDAGLIWAGQRLEHYEMAGYGTARSLAQRLGESAAAEMLQQTLDEEHEADLFLADIAETESNLHAML